MFKNHNIKKVGHKYEITLYVDIDTEFADELGNKGERSKEQLDKSVKRYIKEKFPDVKQATVKVMVGTMLVSTLAFGAGGAIKSVGAEAPTFSDVDQQEYFADPISFLVERGIISGYEDDTFKPGNDITRAEFSKMLAIALDLDTTAGTADFPDVPAGNWASPYIAALSSIGIINGYPDGTFQPNQTITRAEMAKMLVTAYDSLNAEEDVALPFNDVNDNWAKSFIAGLYKNNITTGLTATTFAPNEDVNRGQAATFLYRSINQAGELPPEEEEVVAEVASVTTINNPYFITNDKTIFAFNAFLFLDEEGNRIDDVDLTGYTIADSAGYFNSDGTLSENYSENGITTEGTISVQISKDGQLLDEVDIKVVAGDDYNAILDAEIQNTANESVGYTTIGSTFKFNVSKALQNDGDVISRANGDTIGLTDFDGADLSSSNDAVLVVKDDGTITPLSTGTANIIVNWNDKTFTYSVEVKETPEVSSIDIVAGNTLSLTSGENERSFDYTVKDQHGADFTEQAVTFDAIDADNAIEVLTLRAAEGKIIATIDKATVTKDVSGTYAIKATDGTELGQVTVNYRVAGDIESFDLRTDQDNTTIDHFLNGTNVTVDGETVEDDDTVSFKFIGLDGAGLVAGIFNSGDAANNTIDKYSISLTGVDETNPEADVAVDANGNITVTATEHAPREGKTVTVTVKEGNIERASATVFVQNTTPDPRSLTTFVLADQKEQITITSNTTFADLVAAGIFVSEDQYGKTFNLTGAEDLKLYSGDEDVFTIGDNNAITITGVDGDTANLVVNVSGVSKAFNVIIDTTPDE